MYVEPPPTKDDLLEEEGRLWRVIRAPRDQREIEIYLHWNKLKRLAPPEGLSSEDWWLRIKFERRSELKRLPLLDGDDNSPVFSGGQNFLSRLGTPEPPSNRSARRW